MVLSISHYGTKRKIHFVGFFFFLKETTKGKPVEIALHVKSLHSTIGVVITLAIQ